MAYEELDFESYSSETAASLENVQEEFKRKLEDLIGDSRNISAYGIDIRKYYEDIGEITFESIPSAESLLGNIEFQPIPNRDLLPPESDQYVTHTFISPHLDDAENKIIEFVSSDYIKGIDSALIGNSMISMFEGLILSNDLFETEESKKLLDRYQSPDIDGNKEWLDEMQAISDLDRKKIFYTSLFDIAQKDASFAASHIKTIEDLHASFTTRYNGLVSKLIDANIAAYKADVLANIKKVELGVKKVGAELDVKALEYDQLSNEFKLNIKQAVSRLNAYASRYSADLRTNIDNLRIRISGSLSAAEGYSKIFQSNALRYSAVSLGRQ